MAGKPCILSLLQGMVESINFVYDTNLRKESVCWCFEELIDCFMSKVCSNKMDNIHVSQDCIVSKLHEETMNHPLFDFDFEKEMGFISGSQLLWGCFVRYMFCAT